MIVDSTALPEQAVQAIVESAFQSAGQRCSALRCLYVQEDIAKDFIDMLIGAMKTLRLGNPWNLSTDVGPIIDKAAQTIISDHIVKARSQGRVLAEIEKPANGFFVGPTLIRVDSICELEREVFGPVLHIATFKAHQLDEIINDINATGYGLTFGLQTRIDDRVQYVSERIEAGNIYVNRNQIGAIVGSQPFGGHGLSGTGPKAGGPNYLKRFAAVEKKMANGVWNAAQAELPPLPDTHYNGAIKTDSLPGPTGESNRLSTVPRPALLCLGPGAEAAGAQARAVTALGGIAVTPEGMIDPEALQTGPAYGGVIWWGDDKTARVLDQALAQREGALTPLITSAPDSAHVLLERHVCVDTTASGGNAALLGMTS